MGNGPLRAPYAGNELTNIAYTGNGQSKWPNMISDMPSNRQLTENGAVENGVSIAQCQVM